MIKFTLLLRRNPALTRAEFIDYHQSRHAPLFVSVGVVKRYVRRYVQQHTFPIELPGLPPVKYDGITELWFDDIAGLNAVFSDLEYLARVRADEQHFLDVSACDSVVSAENVVLETSSSSLY